MTALRDGGDDAADDDDDDGIPELPLRTGQRVGAYTLGPRLGRGAAGEVYRATADDGQLVAIKILRADKSPSRQELRFRREIRAVARLDHPHVLRVLGEGRTDDDGALYMVTELAAGGDLRRMVAVTETPELLAVLLQIASALDYVHSQRIVHRDLKPENVLLFPDERGHLLPKLADFGIAALDPALARPMTAAGKLMGTVDFVSPEQVAGEPADPRSDLYALGVMAFELVSGRVPFEQRTVWQALQARVKGPAPPLLTAAPTAPPALAALVDKLLATDPRDRPQAAHLVCLELAAILAALPTAVGVAERVLAGLPTPTGAFLYRPPVIGRDAEVAAIAHAALTGSAVGVALIGEAGAGKTAVTRLVERALAERGFVCVTHALTGDPTRPPFAPFQAIERDLATRAGVGAPANARASADGSWIVARRLSDADAREVVVGRFLASDDAAAWRRRRVRRALDLARQVPAPVGLALVIEDVHEMDGGGWALLGDVLATLATRPAPRPFVVVSARPSAREQLAALAPIGLTLHELGDLDEAAVTATVAAMLGAGTSALPDGLVRQTLAECRGNPLLVQSYLLALVGAGELRRVRGGWTLAAERRSARLPTQMANVLRARLALLSPATREILGVASAIGVAFEAPLLVAIAERPADDVLDALDEALRAGILESTTSVVDVEVLTFTHKRLAEVLSEELAPAARAACHDRIGQALVARGEAAPSILARHFGAGSDDAAAIAWLGAAAEESQAAHDHATSELHLGRLVARLDAAGQPSLAAREALGDALLAQGKGADARAVFVALHAAARTPLERARWLRKEGLARCLASDTVGGIHAFEQALAALGDRVPRSRLGIRWRIVRDLVAARLGRKAVVLPEPDRRLEERIACHRWLGTLFRWVDLERLATHSTTQLRLAERSGDVGQRAYAYAAHAVFWAFLAAPRRAAKIEAAGRRLASAAHDDATTAFVCLMQGATALLGEAPDGAVVHFDKSLDLARRVGDRLLEVLIGSGRGWACMMLGRWRQADEDFSAALSMADALDIQWMRADAGAGTSLLQVAMGHHTEGVARARALADDAALGLPAIRALATEILGGAAYIRGRYQEAATLLADASKQYHRAHLATAWGYLVHIELSEALLWQVDRDGAATVPNLLDRLRLNARRTTKNVGRIPLFRGFDDILAGVIASRRGQKDKALSLFERGKGRRVGPADSYLDTWMNIRVAVERLRLGGPRGEAQRELDAVADTFERQGLRGMLAWLVQMRTELGL